eukprot:1392924-Amorphochlora_amoeboformis.AAC.2
MEKRQNMFHTDQHVHSHPSTRSGDHKPFPALVSIHAAVQSSSSSSWAGFVTASDAEVPTGACLELAAGDFLVLFLARSFFLLFLLEGMMQQVVSRLELCARISAGTC